MFLLKNRVEFLERNCLNSQRPQERPQTQIAPATFHLGGQLCSSPSNNMNKLETNSFNTREQVDNKAFRELQNEHYKASISSAMNSES